MFANLKIVLVASIALAGAAVAVAAPASAGEYNWNRHVQTYNNTYTYQPHHTPHVETYRYSYHPTCTWVWQNVQEYGKYGPIWVNKRVQICN